MQTIRGKVVDIKNRQTFNAEIVIENRKINSITEITEDQGTFILPGFIDAHVHIESSMLVPSEFAKVAVRHGTVATVSDPHEIANVCGIEGINYMINNAAKVPFHFNFGAPSCVPATQFESAGATINAVDIAKLLMRDDIKYLSEMMNFPGVLFNDAEVMKKIEWAKYYNKPIDGHAPGLSGAEAIQYIKAGISTDHECTGAEEALHKLKHGMKILIREGSAAKNFNALIELLPKYKNQMMFCCDDKHPDELLLHHINHHVKMAIQMGYDVYDVLQVACLNPIEHYRLHVGALQVGDPADFIVVNNLRDFEVQQTYIDGQCVYSHGKVHIEAEKEQVINHFNCLTKTESDIKLPWDGRAEMPIINALNGQLLTTTYYDLPKIEADCLVSDTKKDLLKLVVVNRYQEAKPSVAFIKNFGLQNGAIGGTVAHDCHNIIVVGVDDLDILACINSLIENKGGICVVKNEQTDVLPLPVGGIMSNEPATKVGALYAELDKKAKELGSKLDAPFMTLSFMALLVIPEIKLSDKGLWDGKNWKFFN